MDKNHVRILDRKQVVYVPIVVYVYKMSLKRDYPPLIFRTKWELSNRCLIMPGQCTTYIKAINNTPNHASIL